MQIMKQVQEVEPKNWESTPFFEKIFVEGFYMSMHVL